MSFTPTEEQAKIVSAAVSGKNVTINALAGAAKTTTCALIAKSIVKPSLYLAFNKAMQEEAKTKMPSHVECRTWHSIAFQAVGLDYQHKLTRPQGPYRNLAGTGGEIARYFKIKPLELLRDGFIGSIMFGIAVKKTLARFEYSEDVEVGVKHVDYSVLKKFGGPHNLKSSERLAYENTVVEYARELWKLREDMNSPVLITHDTYLKIFQLTNPVLRGYEVIYADEHQDTSMTMNDILIKQKAQKIVVGDVFQKIYGWRGSVDGMSISDGVRMSLSKSFRFGEAVAEVANSIIGAGRVKGCDKESEVILGAPECFKGKTVLFRTNSALFTMLVTLLQEGYSVATEVDTAEFRRLVESCLYLMRGELRKVKHEDILPYESWSELKMSIKNGAVDGNITNVCRLVESGEYLSVLGAMDKVSRPENADVLLTTAHKSKGREWSEVVVMNDFPDYEQEGVNQEERNLYYVACTRAIDKLYYTPIETETEKEPSRGINFHTKKVYNGRTGLMKLAEKELEDVLGIVHGGIHSDDVPYVSGETSWVDSFEAYQEPANIEKMVNKQMSAWGWDDTGELEQLSRLYVQGRQLDMQD